MRLSPYSDGEKDTVTNDFANCQRCKMGANVAAICPSPRHYTGEGAGRRMRDSAKRQRLESVAGGF
ncbi:conserved hypothetical protein [Mesorhizobium prunaredense]|uniref:Uncharacterized protein n=1 Tax=Mesorhizobium prunaredense TaxID=1631249 RepID=A0A1R3UZ54_9HYPH|nr:conserved hypothetical protein [Mesorhizobium prunaredense]